LDQNICDIFDIGYQMCSSVLVFKHRAVDIGDKDLSSA